MTITRVVFGTGAYIQVVPGSGHRSALTPGKDGVKSITWLAHGLLGFETDDGRRMTVYPPPGTVVEETEDKEQPAPVATTEEPDGPPSGPTSAAGEAALPGKARGRVQR